MPGGVYATGDRRGGGEFYGKSTRGVPAGLRAAPPSRHQRPIITTRLSSVESPLPLVGNGKKGNEIRIGAR